MEQFKIISEFPGECIPNPAEWHEDWYTASRKSGNWYQLADEWINYNDAGYDDNLMATYLLNSSRGSPPGESSR